MLPSGCVDTIWSQSESQIGSTILTFSVFLRKVGPLGRTFSASGLLTVSTKVRVGAAPPIPEVGLNFPSLAAAIQTSSLLAAASSRQSATDSICASVNSGNIGNETNSLAIRSEIGKAPFPYPRLA